MKRDFHVDDKDGLTDMTLLHFASKAGCEGVGERDSAHQLISLLLESRATPELRCRWSDMTALHYAVYFDAAPIIALLLNATQFRGVEPFPSDTSSKCSPKTTYIHKYRQL